MKPMNILWIVPELPFPLTSGGRIGVFYRIRELARRGHRITLFSVVDQPTELEPAPELLELCAEVRLYLRRSGLRPLLSAPWKPYYVESRNLASMHGDIARAMGEQHFDLIQIDHTNVSPYLPARPAGTAACFTAHNLDQRLFRDNARTVPFSAKKLAFHFEAAKVGRFERALYASGRFDGHIFVSSDELAWVTERYPQVRAAHIPSGVLTDRKVTSAQQQEHRTAFGPSPMIVFTGKMDFDPNVDAACWFASKVFPLIKARIPEVRFFVVGAQPSARVRELAIDPQVVVTGTVPEVYPYLAAADVCVVPTRSGAGIKMKLLEALAHGKPVVCTPGAVSGLALEPGVHLHVAADAAEFANRCVYAIQQPEAMLPLADAGFGFVDAHYSWGLMGARQEAFYAELLERRRAGADLLEANTR